MFSLAATRDADAARASLSTLVSPAPLDQRPFSAALGRIDRRFAVYAATCPVPLPSAGLIVTPEIRRQSELYLPMTEIRALFFQLYRQALRYPPIFSSTPFHAAASWADLYTSLPPAFQSSANPAAMLRYLLDSPELLSRFLCESFLPHRFYNGFKRYPGQLEFIRTWLDEQHGRPLHCLDAACGTGEGSYDLALLLAKSRGASNIFSVQGWTVEPLEVWAAAHLSFPHAPEREAAGHLYTDELFRSGCARNIHFCQADVRKLPDDLASQRFDLILCNGLLGGPIVNRVDEMKLVAGNLAGLLSPGGILLAADSFHEGWKKKIPGEILGDLLKRQGLSVCAAGEGLAAAALH